MTDRKAKATTTAKSTPAKTSAPERDTTRCVVDGCKLRRVPGSKVCSAHTMHYHRDGSRRDGKGRNV